MILKSGSLLASFSLLLLDVMILPAVLLAAHDVSHTKSDVSSLS